MKYLIFDFDGTIVNNLSLALKLARERLAENGIKLTKTDEELRNQGIKSGLKELKLSKIKMVKIFRELKSQIAHEIFDCTPTKELPETLSLLKHGAKLGIFSSNKPDIISRYLKKYQLDDHFDFIAEDNSYFGKYRGLNRLVKKIGAKKTQVIYIGDETRDIEAAKKTGVRSAAVIWGFEGEKPLRASNPDYVFSHPKELLQLIND